MFYRIIFNRICTFILNPLPKLIHIVNDQLNFNLPFWLSTCLSDIKFHSKEFERTL